MIFPRIRYTEIWHKISARMFLIMSVKKVTPHFLRLRVPTIEQSLPQLPSAGNITELHKISGSRRLRKPGNNGGGNVEIRKEMSSGAKNRRCKGCTIPRTEEQLEWYIVKHIKMVPGGNAIPMRTPELENSGTYKKMCYCSDRCVALRIHQKYVGNEINRLMNNLHILKLVKFGIDTEILPAPNPMKLCFYVEGGLTVEEYDRMLNMES